MYYTTLKKEYHINGKTGFKYHYVNSETEIFKPHNHEFYEIMIIDKGTPVHVVSGEKSRLKTNTIMLIRPGDVHEFLKDSNFYFATKKVIFTTVLFLSFILNTYKPLQKFLIFHLIKFRFGTRFFL